MTTLSSTLALAPEIERAEWKAFDDGIRPIEARFAQAIYRAHLAALDVLREHLDSPGALDEALAAARAVLTRLLGEALGVHLLDAMRFGWDRAARQIEAARQRKQSLIDVPLDLWMPEVAWYIRDRVHEYSPPMSEATIERLRTVLREGFDHGLGVDEVVRSIIDERLPGISKQRAEVISRTELISASNRTALLGYQRSGVVAKKRWLSTRDERTRASHRSWEWPEEMQAVPLDEPFSLLPMDPGGEVSLLQYPGDTSLGAALDQIVQ